MSDTRYLGFDETMDMLGLSEDQLMDLVAANELRAFRIDRDMKFKESDIRTRQGQGAAAASAAGAPEAEEAVELEEADDLSVDLVAQEPAEAGEALELEELEEPVALMDAEEALPAEEAVPELAAQESPLELSEIDESELEVSAAEETLATVEIPDSGLVEAGGVDLAAGDEAETQAVGEDSEVGDGTEVVLESSSSDGLGTEEIVFEDEDLAIGDAEEEELGTQEVTVREEALEDEAPTIADQQITLDLGEDEGDTVAPQDEEEPETSRPLSGRRSAGSVRRRGWEQPKAAGGKGDLAFAAVLAITCLAMILPIMLYATIAWKGYTLGRETLPVGDIKLGQPVEMAAVFKPDWTDLFRDKLVDVFGSPLVKKPALAPVATPKPAEAAETPAAKPEEKPAENAK